MNEMKVSGKKGTTLITKNHWIQASWKQLWFNGYYKI